MAIKLSALMQVYNEEICLPASLGGILPAVDQCVIVDGNEFGPSTDKSKQIIDGFIEQYPGKITYIADAFCKEGDQWDNTMQNNIGLQAVTGDFVFRTHGDMVYDTEAALQIRDIVERFPDKRYFYCPMIDFYVDTYHILLTACMEQERILPRPTCQNAVVFSMAGEPRYVDASYGDKWVRSGLHLELDWNKDIQYMPHVKRFHYANVKPFKYQIAKMIRNTKKGDFQAFGDELRGRGEKAMYSWAIEQVLAYPQNSSIRPYAGQYPAIGDDLRPLTYLDGYDEFMSWYVGAFGE